MAMPLKSQPVMLHGLRRCVIILWLLRFRATASTRTRTCLADRDVGLGTGAVRLMAKGR